MWIRDFSLREQEMRAPITPLPAAAEGVRAVDQ
jgi:hypothetical protein